MYVDHGLNATIDHWECEIFIEKLKARFKIVSGNTYCFPGLETEYEKDGASLKVKYIISMYIMRIFLRGLDLKKESQ